MGVVYGLIALLLILLVSWLARDCSILYEHPFMKTLSSLLSLAGTFVAFLTLTVSRDVLKKVQRRAAAAEYLKRLKSHERVLRMNILKKNFEENGGCAQAISQIKETLLQLKELDQGLTPASAFAALQTSTEAALKSRAGPRNSYLDEGKIQVVQSQVESILVTLEQSKVV